MQVDTHALVTFFLAGRREGAALAPVDGLALRPALFAPYADLTRLRHDFPVVLVAKGAGFAPVEPLSGLFDRALEKAAAGPDGDCVRKQDLRLESEIRQLVARGTSGTLSALLDLAGAHAGREPGFEDSRRRLRAALGCDGELADCDAALPRRVMHHLWQHAQRAKAEAFRAKAQRLTLKLAALLRADLERSARGYAPQRIEAGMGPGFAGAFDFDAMSRLVTRSLRCRGLPPERRQRISRLLQVLQSQRFFPGAAGVAPYEFEFDGCAAALKAWRERLPKLSALARALAMAELEVTGEYDPARHDALFAEGPLAAEELAAFPDYFVHVGVDHLPAAEQAVLTDILASGLPMKVLLQVDDLAGDPAAESPALRARQLANLAMGLDTAYVVQASASHLLRLRERLAAGLSFPGPALFSVYSGAGGQAGVPAYLLAAAAAESRVFPAFTYDPGAGENWATRFSIDGNPQAQSDWPLQPFAYEDEAHQSVSQELAFTAVDFLAADARWAPALAKAPRDAWNGRLVPVADALDAGAQGVLDRIPSVLMIDRDNRLHKVVVDRRLLRQAARCRDLWRNLQELAGIHNSHADLAVARAQREWGATPAQPTAVTAEAPTAPAVAPVAAPPAAEAPEAPEHAPGEPYIETARCSSCNECIQLNPKMFAYDANQQAYIADANAGTYAQLVEAAESCQVAVIHPGAPRNAAEPGLAELLKRAEAFA